MVALGKAFDGGDAQTELSQLRVSFLLGKGINDFNFSQNFIAPSWRYAVQGRMLCAAAG